MTKATNAENMRQYKSRFSFIVEQILAFTLSTNLVRKVKNFVPKFQTNCTTTFYIIDKSHSDRQIHFIVKL